MRTLLSVIAMSLGVWSSSQAQPASGSAQIREFDLPTTERLGAMIFRQDVAAWVGTDALLAKTPAAELQKEGVRGWIVESRDAGMLVRFLRDQGRGLEAAYDIKVTSPKEASVATPADRTLTPMEVAAYTAVQTAKANLPSTCRPGYNSAIARDPDGSGWLVWLLAPMPKAGVVPVGGHYRFTISDDGRTVEQRDALSASCLVMDPTQGVPNGAKPQVLFVTHVVSPKPTEAHVFLQLQSGISMAVAAGDHLWMITRGHITDSGPLKPAKPAG